VRVSAKAQQVEIYAHRQEYWAVSGTGCCSRFCLPLFVCFYSYLSGKINCLLHRDTGLVTLQDPVSSRFSAKVSSRVVWGTQTKSHHSEGRNLSLKCTVGGTLRKKSSTTGLLTSSTFLYVKSHSSASWCLKTGNEKNIWKMDEKWSLWNHQQCSR